MTNKISTHIQRNLSHSERQQIDFEVMEYGIYGVLVNTIKTLVLIAAALLLGIWKYVLVFLFTLASLRLVSFGVHLKNTYICTLLGLGYCLGGTYAAMYLSIPVAVKIVVLTVCFLFFARYAPAETKARPIPAHSRRTFKAKSLITLAVVLAVSLLLHSLEREVYSNLLLLAAACQTVNLLPITYKLFQEE